MVPFQAPSERVPATGAERSAALRFPPGRGGALQGSNSNTPLRFLITMPTQAVFETGPTGEVDRISPSWQAYTGQDLEQARGFGWLTAFHPDDRDAIIAARVAAMRTGTDVNGEFRLRRTDGGWCWSNVRAVPVRGADGRITSWAGMTIDISARREAEARLVEVQEDYRYAIDLNPQMLWTARPDGRIRSVSERWCRFIGQPRERAMAAVPADFISGEDVRATALAYRRSIASGDPLDTHFRVKTAEGERWVRARAWPRRNGDGAILRWYGVCEDVHVSILARQESEAADERRRLVAEATRDIIWDLDIATGMVTWNSAIAARFGHRLDSDRSDQSWWIQQIHPEDRACVIARFSDIRAGATGTVRWTDEYRFARADGSYAHVLDRGGVIPGRGGTPIRAIGAIVDLSEKRHADHMLRIGEERLRLAVAASGLGISDYDVRTDTLHWSDELRAILGSMPTSRPARPRGTR